MSMQDALVLSGKVALAQREAYITTESVRARIKQMDKWEDLIGEPVERGLLFACADTHPYLWCSSEGLRLCTWHQRMPFA